VLDEAGKLVRRYSSNDKPSLPDLKTVAFPPYWFKLPEKLSTAAGLHRWVWNLRYANPTVPTPEYSMSTAFGTNTPAEPEGPQILPGNYQVRLTVDGKSVTQKFSVTMDPRVKTSAEDLQKQFALEMKIYHALQQGNVALTQIRNFYKRNEAGEGTLRRSVASGQELQALAQIEPPAPEPGQQPPARTAPPTLSRLIGALQRLAVVVDSADAAPTTQATKAAEQIITQLQSLVAQWEKLRAQ